jgi:exodeoxyribonuclease-3
MKLYSWNVNGLRAAVRGGADQWLAQTRPEVLCLQEVKALPTEVPAALFADYHVTWNPAQKKGYSGTLLASKEKPQSVALGLGKHFADDEGRVITATFADFIIVTVYTPNSQRELARLGHRLEWDAAFQDYVNALRKKKPVLFCGDLNVSHQEIDLSHPTANRKNAGFTDDERQSFDRLIQQGWIDTFRAQHPGEKGHHSWWTYRSDARARNIGWRLDYWMASPEWTSSLGPAAIHADVLGSDHCPVSLTLK